MILRFSLSAGLLCVGGSAWAEVLLSQYYEGSSSNKWIELVNTGSAAVSLNGLVLTSWNNAASENWKTEGGTPNNAHDLSGRSIPANGYLLIGNATAGLPGYAQPDLTSTVTTFINGNDSVVLYDTSQGAVGATAAIVDAIALTNTGNEGADTSFYRLSNAPGFDLGAGSSVLDFGAVWAEKTNAEVDGATPTDGWYLNRFVSSVSLSVNLDPASVVESEGSGLVAVTVTRTGPNAEALAILLSSSDESEAVIPAANQQIPAGQAFATFAMAIDAVDDQLEDGIQTVTITASGVGFNSGTAALAVEDDADRAPLAINEVLADPPGGDDVNGDGTASTSQDEFIELVNTSGAELDISFWEIHDGFSFRHFFDSGTVLPAGCAIVVFGGGLTGALSGSSLFQVASSGTLDLTNSGDTITVQDDGLNPVAVFSWGGEGGNNESLARDVDVTGSFVPHTGANGSGGAPYSVGTMIDGSPFCPAAGDLSIALNAGSMNENGGSLIARLRRSGDRSEPLEVLVRFDDSSEAVPVLNQAPDGVSYLATIPAGQSAFDVTVLGVDDLAADGTQTVTLTITAVRYNKATTTFEVNDDGDGPFGALVINEILYDPPNPGGDSNQDGAIDSFQDEFVELLNVSGAAFDLSMYELHDALGVRHVFGQGTLVGAGQAIIVFGGGNPTGTFGGSLIAVANRLTLNNDGDSVILKTPGGGSELLRVDYDGSVADKSITRDPDGTGSLEAHSTARGSGGALYSPGHQVNGSVFAGGVIPGALDLKFFGLEPSGRDVRVRVSGLQPSLSYTFEVSLDLGAVDPWFFLQNFTTADGVEISPGLYEFVFADPLIPHEDKQFYRVRRP